MQFGYREELAVEHCKQTVAFAQQLQGAVNFEDLCPTLMSKSERIQGSVTEPTVVILHNTVKKLTGSFLPSQNQPRGTCTSRGVKRVLDLLQYAQIDSGMLFEFRPTNHAIIYGLGREIAGMLGGNPNNSNDDGCTGSAVARGVVNGGNLTYEDTSDTTDNENDDRLACLYGARGVPSEYKTAASAHLVKGLAAIKTLEAAKASILSGRAFTVASNVGFLGNGGRYVRNSNGICRAGSNWSHQMCITGYCSDLAGQGPAYLQDQSWGPNQPSGPLGPYEIPSYSFWTIESDLKRQISQNDSWTFAGMEGWNTSLIHWLI